MSSDDQRWPAGLSAPAIRALEGAGYRKLVDLTAATHAELSALHGFGPKGLRIIQEALAAHGLGLGAPPVTTGHPGAAG